MIYDANSDTHGSMDVIDRYAMPNLGARYTADRIDATKWDCDYPSCAVCGKTVGSFAVHHEPPREKGSLLLVTRKWGRHVVKPSLLLLCEECHRDRHDRGYLRIDWEWDPGERERFLSGHFLSNGYREHDTRFFRHGKVVFSWRGKRIEYREEVPLGLPTVAELKDEARRMAERDEEREAVMDRIGYTGGPE